MSSHKPVKRKKIVVVLLILIVAGFLIPQKFSMPVEGASSTSYNAKSFWYYPWGKSITHKGVDIFAPEGTAIKSATSGLVIFKGQMGIGGNVVLILGPKWRVHYYAHLKDIHTVIFSWVNSNEGIGTVGTSGNAKGKPPPTYIIPY